MDDAQRQSLWEKTLGGKLTVHSPGETLRPELTTQPESSASGSEEPILSNEEWDYELEERIGRGGMGLVYRAKQRSLGRLVAVKTLDGAASSAKSDQFRAEAQLTGLLDHPNIVPVHDLQELDQRLYLSMKLVLGRPWSESLQDPETSLDEHIRILLAVCQAVRYAHSKGVIHCDLKPDNVMIGDYGEVLVMDWGVAVSLSSDEGSLLPRHIDVKQAQGTPVYMAPELAEGRGADIGVGTDVYLLGAILFEMITGKPPHSAATLIQVLLSAAQSKDLEFPEGVSDELREICSGAMRRDVTERYESVTEFQDALNRYLDHGQSRVLTEKAEARGKDFDSWALKDREPDQSLARGPYSTLNQILASLEQALELWPENRRALTLKEQSHRRYLNCALSFGDIGLAEYHCEFLDQEIREVEGAKIEAERIEREKQRKAKLRLRQTFAGALVIGFLGLTLALYFINEQRDLAEERGRIARESLRGLALKTRERLGVIPGEPIREAREDLIDFARVKLEALDRLDSGAVDAALRGEIQLQIAELKKSEGKDDEARLAYERATGYLARNYEERGDIEALREYVRAILQSAQFSFDRGKVGESSELLAQAERRLKAEKGAGLTLMRALCFELRGLIQSKEEGRGDSALKSFQSFHLEMVKLCGEDPATHLQALIFARSLQRLGEFHEDRAELNLAKKYFQAQFELSARLVKKTPWSQYCQMSLARAGDKLGVIARRQGFQGEARRRSKRAVAAWRTLTQLDPASQLYRWEFSNSLERFSLDLRQGQFNEDALNQILEIKELRERLVVESPGNKSYQWGLLKSRSEWSWQLGLLGRIQESLAVMKGCVKSLSEMTSDNDRRYSEALLSIYHRLSMAQTRVGQFKEALEMVTKGRQLLKALSGAEALDLDGELRGTRFSLLESFLRLQLGQYDLALEVANRGYEAALRLEPKMQGSSEMGEAAGVFQERLGHIYLKKNEPKKALLCFERKLKRELAQLKLNPDLLTLLNSELTTLSNIASIYLRLKREEERTAILERAYRKAKKVIEKNEQSTRTQQLYCEFAYKFGEDLERSRQAKRAYETGRAGLTVSRALIKRGQTGAFVEFYHGQLLDLVTRHALSFGTRSDFFALGEERVKWLESRTGQERERGRRSLLRLYLRLGEEYQRAGQMARIHDLYGRGEREGEELLKGGVTEGDDLLLGRVFTAAAYSKFYQRKWSEAHKRFERGREFLRKALKREASRLNALYYMSLLNSYESACYEAQRRYGEALGCAERALKEMKDFVKVYPSYRSLLRNLEAAVRRLGGRK